jgi:hypothetical protein
MVVPPYWFDQRQGKAEPVGEDALRLTAPNLKEAVIGIRKEGDRYSAYLRPMMASADIATTPPEVTNPLDAWESAFELYRREYVV